VSRIKGGGFRVSFVWVFVHMLNLLLVTNKDIRIIYITEGGYHKIPVLAIHGGIGIDA
jgi:hypothetical protein